LKTKQDSNDNVERYKFRLVAKCFTQKNDIDYKKIFSLVSKKDKLKIIMVLVTHYNLELHKNECEKYLFSGNIFLKKVHMDEPKRLSSEEKEYMDLRNQYIYLNKLVDNGF
jgi:hypothetical protein